MAACSAGQGRPTTVFITKGVIDLQNVSYDSGTSVDLTQPASGHGDLILTIGSTAFPAETGVAFQDLVTDATGKISKGTLTLPTQIQMDAAFGAGTSLVIPPGQATCTPGQLQLANTGSLTIPFRDATGVPIVSSVPTLQSTATSMILAGIQPGGQAAQDGLKLAGVTATGALTFTAIWAATAPNPVSWTVTGKTVGLNIPGLAVDKDCPIKATVTNLAITQTGSVSFDSGVISAGKVVPIEAAGFEVDITSGQVSMQNSKPTFNSVTGDLKLPLGVSDPTGNQVIVHGITIDLTNGLVVTINKSTVKPPPQPTTKDPTGSNVLDCKVGGPNGISITATELVLDLSSATAPAGAASAPVSTPSWEGLWIKSGHIKVPLGPTGTTENVGVDMQNFLVESQGVSGDVSADIPQMSVAGFNLVPVTPANPQVHSFSLKLKRNQLVKADINGGINIPTYGTIQAGFTFDLVGNLAFKFADNQALNIGSLGLKIARLQGKLDNGNISMSGNLTFDTTKIQDVPPALQNVNLQITNLKITKSGQVILPTDGFITFATPATVDCFGLVEVEIRRVGFTSNGSKLTSVKFSGGARLENLDDSLPVSGDLDLEGLSISSTDNSTSNNPPPPSAGSPPLSLPKFDLQGIGLDVNILGIGDLSGTLHRKTIAGFGDTLYGGASLNLTSLGTVSGGLGLDFMVAPSKAAWFVGGNFTPPTPILVEIPAVPVIPTPPIPLFNIEGFSGGFGLNVTKSDLTYQGRITDPTTQLAPKAGGVLLQAGLLVADPVPAPLEGHIWWADTALTFTLKPLTVGIGGKAVFLDPGKPAFLNDADWHKKDRIASAFLTFDFSTPSVIADEAFDLTFPTRTASLLNASGQGEMKVGHNVVLLNGAQPSDPPKPSDGILVHIGSKRYGDKPINLSLGPAISGIADASIQGGLDFSLAPVSSNPPSFNASGHMFITAHAKFDAIVASVDANFDAGLDLQGLGGPTFSAFGHATVKGIADFGFFSAECEGNCTGSFNTSDHPNQFYVAGSVTGEVAGFRQTVQVNQTLFTVPTT
jgi:hypothetical protein